MEKIPTLKELALSQFDIDLLSDAGLYFVYYGDKECSWDDLRLEQKNWIKKRLEFVKNLKSSKIDYKKADSQLLSNWLNDNHYHFSFIMQAKKVIFKLEKKLFENGRSDIDKEHFVKSCGDFLKRKCFKKYSIELTQ
jgi:hypothetical protein